MELVNHSRFHPIDLWFGRKIGQMKFIEVDPPESSYRKTGRYNGDAVATPSKGF
jgi:deoxycytidine triphosphate deaminase